MNITRIDEPLQCGACNDCIHGIKIKRTMKCDQIQNKNGKYIACREIRVCESFKKSYYIRKSI